VTFLLRSGGDGFKVTGLQGTDIGRMAELAETYLDLRLASLVSTAKCVSPLVAR
jgi:hypothetical protein